MFKYIMMLVVLCLMSLTSCTSVRNASLNEQAMNRDGSSCICVSNKGDISLKYISGFSSGSLLDE